MSEEERNQRREYEKNKHRNMSEEQKSKKREFARNRYHTMIKVC